MSPKITVITVCYNSAATIGDTLAAVSRQGYKNVEHLIVDGASTDGTVEIVRQWAGHPVVMTSEPDKGIYDAMNKGLARATGDVIGFLNADDFYADSSALEKIAAAFQDKQTEACFGDLVYVSKDNRQVVRFWRSRAFVKGAFAKGWCPAHPTFYIRRSALDRCGVFDRAFKLASDVEFMMRYLENGDVRSVYIPAVIVRMRVGGATNQSWRNVLQQNKEVLLALRKNNVPFSTIGFVSCKLQNRLWQYITARFGVA
jgi:glycosyltransferase involved in cell wall biosynthesis